ncbi:Retrovirus-related Pol polyprotein from transposon 17.6, partial [Mucuna pruriens]
MLALFYGMMHKVIELYVDDMIVKSKTPEQHVEDLRKLFERLQKYKLRLNPAKCTFGVKSGRLLGFIVNERGIEVDPNKVKVIWEMSDSTIESEVRGFMGRINYIARFISQLTTTCSPIFKLLHKNQKMDWNLNCQEAFEKKRPVLIPVVPRKPLILYLTVLEESMVWATKGLRQYMLAHTTWLISKIDLIKYIFEKPTLIGRIAYWQMAL